MNPPRYILALDESGQTHVRDPKGQTYGFIEGGLVVQTDRVDDLVRRLDAFKSAFVGDTASEVKSHELAGAIGPVGAIGDFEHALAYVSIAFRDCGAILAGAFLEKSAFFGGSVGGIIVPTTGAGVRVNQQLLFEMMVLAFGAFLKRRDARGDVVHDQLSGRPVETEWRSSFDALLAQHPEERGRIDSLSFADSKSSKLVQLADIAIGLLRAHFEKDVLLRDGAAEMAREAERNALLLNVQP
jgi:hypothetical protein